jgi:hypothetical protein
MDEQYSLQDLRDIVVPEAPPLWPLATEVWLLLFVVVAAIAITAFQWRRARQARAYRRAGEALLQGAGTVYEVSVILKRVALVAFPREQVASLYGQDWAEFLKLSCRGKDFVKLVGADPEMPADAELKRLAGAWIRRHRVPQAGNN